MDFRKRRLEQEASLWALFLLLQSTGKKCRAKNSGIIKMLQWYVEVSKILFKEIGGSCVEQRLVVIVNLW